MTISLLIRLSDERSWACEPFLAEGPDSLRDGCLEAFVALRSERSDSGRPRSLFVQVCYHGEWCAQPWTPVIREPGSVPVARHAWVDDDWLGAWARCLRTWKHVHALGPLIHRIAWQ